MDAQRKTSTPSKAPGLRQVQQTPSLSNTAQNGTGDDKNQNRNLPQGPTAPAISLPKGGGAIRGMGEKFSVNAATGTASAQVPVPLTPGRDGHGPDSLSIGYASDAGNGPWGLGWRMSFGSITRKTDKGLPKYDDTDVFMFEGLEDLVPRFRTNPDGTLVVDQQGGYALHSDHLNGWQIQRFAPRIESQFTRIEKWTNDADPDDTHWRVISTGGSVSIFGLTDESRIYDTTRTGAGKKIFSWQLCQTYDIKGNCSIYTYVRENSVGVDLTTPSEIGRTDDSRRANLYLKSIKYGNRQPNRDFITWQPTDPWLLPSDTWMFEVILDYGEHDLRNPKPGDRGDWPCRKDPFSNYRSCFDVRTYRLCRRVLMFHHFPDKLGQADYLVSSTTFEYDENYIATYMIRARKTGYMVQSGSQTPYIEQTFPPLEFEYSRLPTPEELDALPIQTMDEAALEGLPSGFSGAYQAIDLEGDGLTGVLFESDSTWYYKRNVSANSVRASFRPPVALPIKPAAVLEESFQLLTLTGDGKLDVVAVSPQNAGFYERSLHPARTTDGRTEFEAGWETFRNFSKFPNIDFNDANTKLLDVTGDGLTDILISEDDKFIFYQSIGVDGFLPGQIVPQSIDEDKGPRVLFSDPEHSIFLADMSGDGMPDLVRITRPGVVCYWPNLGYGQFGAKIVMGNSPSMDYSDQFDARRIRLMDIDGSGTSDILYIASDHIQVYRNCSGNSWTNSQLMNSVPVYDDLVMVQPMDLLGRGTTCLVWSSSKPGDVQAPVHYLDLMNGVKPHLLVRAWNNMGAETRYTYTPSTEFYLDDENAGKPWYTHLPFPVHCVSKIESYDYISRTRFATRYAYHHGYYDGWERESRGFASVEHWDTEEYSSLDDTTSDEAVNWSSAFISPPVYTKQFFHTGAYVDGDEISVLLAREYFGAPSPFDGEAFADFIDSHNLKNSLPNRLTPDDKREACRSLKGLTLREEVYTQDKSESSDLPYSITSKNYITECLQPKDLTNQHSIWITHPLETISYQYERQIADPRISHTLSLQRDRFGHDLKSVSVSYGRISSDLPQTPKTIQQQTLITYDEHDYTNFIDDATGFVLPQSCGGRAYEICGLSVNPGAQLFKASDFADDSPQSLQALKEVPAETEKSNSSKWKRLIHQTRVLFRSDDLTEILPLGTVQTLALPAISYALAYTPGMLAKFTSKEGSLIPNMNDTLSQNGYVNLDNDSNWWVSCGTRFFHPSPSATPQQELVEARQHFFYGRRYVDIFGNVTVLDQDGFDLLPIRFTDAHSNVVEGVNDYRVLQPYLVTDVNGNRTQISFDAFGKVVGSAVMGKSTETLGDSLDGFSPVVLAADMINFFKDPRGPVALQLLGNASSRIVYNLDRFYQDPDKRLPAYSATIARETHVSDLTAGQTTKIRVKFSYSDGFDREIQQKNLQEPGPILENGPTVNNRWVGTGWAIFNNKGKQVQKFDPFFDDTHEFKFAKIEGVSPIVLFDAAQRPAVTIHPDHSWSKTLFGSWTQVIYDAGDLVSISDPRNDLDVGTLFQYLDTKHYLPSWYDIKQLDPDPIAKAAATKSKIYDGTPTISHSDSMGRPFFTIMDNGGQGKYSELSIFDIEGNKLQSIDAAGRIVEKSDYNMLGESYHRMSMDTGESWSLHDGSISTMFDWNGRLQRLHTTYDQLRRVKSHYLLNSAASTEMLVDTNVYGDEIDQGQQHNIGGKLFKQYDQAGVLTMPAYDFKGNLLRQEQQLASNYKTVVDWTNIADVALEADIFTTETKYDALNRRVESRSPSNTLTVNVYNEASYIERVQVNLRGEVDTKNQPIFQEYVTNVDYDALGRRTKIQYGNGTTTNFSYNLLTSDLTNIQTSGSSGLIQSYAYTFDIMANVTHLEDKSQQTAFFRNQTVTPSMDYAYDPLGRLVEAHGRERLSTNDGNTAPGPSDLTADGMPNIAPNALATYTETYSYDATNNIIEVKHQGSQASQPGWTRKYNYDAPSLVEPSNKSNKLTSTSTGNVTETYRYDGVEGDAGLMTAMPHLSLMKWDFRDQLAATSAQNINSGSPETTYYVYDSGGQRVRKVTERARTGTDPPRKLKETLYVSGLDIYRKYKGDGTTLKLEKETFKVIHSDKTIALVETRTVASLDPSDSANSSGNLPPERLTRYQLGNYLGSICVELDDSGGVLSYEEYSPYGSTTYRSSRSEVNADKRYRFANKERDKETGLYAYGARYYAAWLGRWTSSDPAGTASDGLNIFAYARCNPTRYNDPGGTESVDWRASLSGMQRAALAVDDWVNEHPFAKGVVDNMDKRGEALWHLPGALKELSQKPVGEIAQTVAKGLYQLGEDTVKAGFDVGYYGTKAVLDGGDENWNKLGNATTDLVLNTADIVTTAVDGLGAARKVGTLAKATKAGATAAVDSAKASIKAFPKVVAESAPEVAGHGVLAMKDPIEALKESGNILMMKAEKVTEGVKAAASAGGKAFKQTKAMGDFVNELNHGTSKMARRYRKLKAGGELKEVAGVSMEEAVNAVKARPVTKLKKLVSKALQKHHDRPQALKNLWEAVGETDFHQTVAVTPEEHWLIHGAYGFFHDSNKLWAKALSEVEDLTKLDLKAVNEIRERINQHYGVIPSTGKTLNLSPRVPFK